MESGGELTTWVGQRVRIELRDLAPPRTGLSGEGSFEHRIGTLVDVGELGIELREPIGGGGATNVRFYPWSAVRSLAPDT